MSAGFPIHRSRCRAASILKREEKQVRPVEPGAGQALVSTSGCELRRHQCAAQLQELIISLKLNSSNLPNRCHLSFCVCPASEELLPEVYWWSFRVSQ